MRESGILYPISSLPSKFGIGSFSREAFEFVDFLKSAGQGFWQILPIGPTGFGDSPYQPFSAFGGNPYFISPEKLIEEGLLTWDEANGFDFGHDQERVDYGALYNNRFALLKIAFNRFKERDGLKDQDYKDFLKKEKFWIDDYCLFMALKNKFEGMSWLEWEKPYRLQDEKTMAAAKKELDLIHRVQAEWDGITIPEIRIHTQKESESILKRLAAKQGSTRVLSPPAEGFA